MSELLEIIQIGIIAYVVFILMSEDMVLHFYARLIDKIPWDWLYKPLGGCLMCFAGQISLWYYLIKYFRSYNLFDHMFFVAGAILVVMILDKLIDYDA